MIVCVIGHNSIFIATDAATDAYGIHPGVADFRPGFYPDPHLLFAELVISVFCQTHVPTIRFQILYVFLVLAHDRRWILHFGVTAHPTAEWTAQQLRGPIRSFAR